MVAWPLRGYNSKTEIMAMLLYSFERYLLSTEWSQTEYFVNGGSVFYRQSYNAQSYRSNIYVN
jgi:hypothetical protein